MPIIGKGNLLYKDNSLEVFASTFFGGAQAKISLPTRLTVAQYFRDCGMTSWPDQRFCLLLEYMVHPEVQPKSSQRQLVDKLSGLLEKDSYVLRKDVELGGLPTFRLIQQVHGVTGAPKYIVFASNGPSQTLLLMTH